MDITQAPQEFLLENLNANVVSEAQQNGDLSSENQNGDSKYSAKLTHGSLLTNLNGNPFSSNSTQQLNSLLLENLNGNVVNKPQTTDGLLLTNLNGNIGLMTITKPTNKSNETPKELSEKLVKSSIETVNVLVNKTLKQNASVSNETSREPTDTLQGALKERQNIEHGKSENSTIIGQDGLAIMAATNGADISGSSVDTTQNKNEHETHSANGETPSENGKTPSATVETPSATGETQSGTVETPSATGETQSATVETQSATVETQDATVETQSATMETQSATMETQSATGETQSTTVETQVAAVKTQSATVETQSTTVETQGAAVETQSATVETQSATGETKGATGETQSATGETQNVTGETQGATGETQGATGELQGATEETKTATRETPSATRETQSAPGETQQATGKTQNATGQKPPAVGQTQSATGETQRAIVEIQSANRKTQGATEETQNTIRETQAIVKQQSSEAETKSPTTQSTQSNTEFNPKQNMGSKLCDKMVIESQQIQANSSASLPQDGFNNLSTDKTQDSARSNSSKQSKPEDMEISDVLIRDVLAGQCTFQQLPPLPKKVVRVFVSSTFTDTKEERNALMQRVYPRLADYCREKHGLEFQVVDMRWGVPEQAADNHSTTDLCLQEIRKCQEVSVGPNFVAIVGDKYGYRPIPSTIPADVFTALERSMNPVSSTAASNTSSTRNDTVTKESTGGDDSIVKNWAVVKEWYRIDENARPPVYILQPISSRLPNYSSSGSSLRKEAQSAWNTAHDCMKHALREAAQRAYTAGQVSHNQRQLFFISVTEREITNGVLQNGINTKDTCFCIIRKISDIHAHISKPVASRFTDLTDQSKLDTEARGLLQQLRDKALIERLPTSNLTKVEINWSVSGAEISMEKVSNENNDTQQPNSTIQKVKAHSESEKPENGTIQEHKEYLESICDRFFVSIRNLINAGGLKQRRMYDDITTDVLQHWHLARVRCEFFEGREDILEQVHQYLQTQHQSPLVIYGNSGCGKTSIMAKIIDIITTQQWLPGADQRYFLVARFLGTSPQTSNLHTLLVSLCSQLSIILAAKEQWQEPEQFPDLIKDFHRLLQAVSDCGKPLVLLLDSIDQLMPAYNAYKLDWLPHTIPEHVQIVLSTIDEGYSILGNIKSKYGESNVSCFEVTDLGESLGFDIISKWLQKDHRAISKQQETVVRKALVKCSLPLYARIAYDNIRRWRSFDQPTEEQLQSTIKGAINFLFENMETKFGELIVKHPLAFLTASRYGLSEMEMEHILSLDDLLLSEVFKFWMPPTRRVAPLLWTRVRTEIHSYVVERSADDTQVLYWYHRQFIETTRERYLKDNTFARYIHQILTEYFLGTWGGGKEKPFTYSPQQVQRFKLPNNKGKADRKVPLQPYIFQELSDESGDTEMRYNKRRLTELPYQLIKCRNHNDMKKLVFFNFEWLDCKLKSSSVQQLIEEIDIFMQADKIMKKDIDMKILYVNMQLIRSFLHKYPNSLSYELSGRLAKYIGKSEVLTELVRQCDSNAGCLVPLTTCFESANLGMVKNITFRSSEPWQKGGCMTCSHDFKTLYVIDYDENGLPVLLSFDVATGEMLQNLPITKTKSEQYQMTFDEYFQLDLMQNKKYLLAFYKQKFIAGYKHSYRNDGFFDVIDLNTGCVFRTFEGFLYRENYFNPLQYSTDNWVCVRFGWKISLINIHNDKRKELNRPHLLSNDEKLFIMCGQKKTDMRDFSNKAKVGEFDVSDTQIAVAASKDFSIVAMMSSQDRQLRIFDLSKKELHANKRYGYVLKWKKSFHLEDRVARAVDELFQPVVEVNEKGEREEKTNNSVSMSVAPDDRHLLVTFRGTTNYISYLWNMGRWNAKYVGVVTPKMPLHGRYPMFNYDGSCIIFAVDKTIKVLSTEDCSQLNEYEMGGEIIDFYASQVSNKILVMLKRSVAILELASNQPGSKSNKDRQNKQQKQQGEDERISVLVPKEETPKFVHRELTIEQQEDSALIEEVPELVTISNPDRVSTARSRRDLALEKHVTPNGLRLVQYHQKAQVIDTLNEEIKYTPRKGDTLQRTVTNQGATATNENIAIQGLQGNQTQTGSSLIELQNGDRIVSDQGKVRLRVATEQNGQWKLMIVPSVYSIYTVEEMKMKRLQSVTVYQESLEAVSNNYLVTKRVKGGTEFLNIYRQDNANCIATYEQINGTHCVRFSLDEAQLFVVDRTFCIRVYLAPSFVSVEQKVQLNIEPNPAYLVHDVLTFFPNRNIIVLCYGLQGKWTYSGTCMYVRVDLVHTTSSPVIEVKPSFEDISTDAKLAIDWNLTLYDLESGAQKYTVPYDIVVTTSDTEQSIFVRRLRSRTLGSQKPIHARLTDDSSHVVFIDNSDNTLHIARLGSENATLIYSCSTHTPDLYLEHGMEIRMKGNLILLRGDDICVPFLLRLQSSVKNKQTATLASDSSTLKSAPTENTQIQTTSDNTVNNASNTGSNQLQLENINYSDDISRAKSLVDVTIKGCVKDLLSFHLHNQKVKPDYHQRNILLQQEPETS